jgi:(1->4)-alpha-D-glucan 1-alpha-D-glucosylmutase
MNATSTHDTKRSEEVRARINVLSELPGEWEKRLSLWSRWNEEKKTSIEGRPVPDRNEEILVYQTLLGAWPFDESEIPSFTGRVADYMVKAVREAGLPGGTAPTRHEGPSALCGFLLGHGGNRFLEDFLPSRGVPITGR